MSHLSRSHHWYPPLYKGTDSPISEGGEWVTHLYGFKSQEHLFLQMFQNHNFFKQSICGDSNCFHIKIGKKCTLGPIHSSSVWRNKTLTLTLTLTLNPPCSWSTCGTQSTLYPTVGMCSCNAIQYRMCFQSLSNDCMVCVINSCMSYIYLLLLKQWTRHCCHNMNLLLCWNNKCNRKGLLTLCLV